MSRGVRTAVVAWLVTALYYFYQYTLRSAPAVMMPQLSEAFGLTAMGIAFMVGLFYWGYSPFSLVAGAAIDGFGARKVIPVGAAVVGVGALLFATGNGSVASVGRFLQGVGGAVAFVGAVYLATVSFPPSRAATLIGATQIAAVRRRPRNCSHRVPQGDGGVAAGDRRTRDCTCLVIDFAAWRAPTLEALPTQRARRAPRVTPAAC